MKETEEEKLIDGLRRLKRRRITGSFPPTEDFKAEFFRRALTRPERRRGGIVQYAVHFLSAAAVVAAAAGLVFWNQQQGSPEGGNSRNCVGASVVSAPGAAVGPSVSAGGGAADPVEMRMLETLLLFGSDTGVGYAGDELFTFTRQESAEPDHMLTLEVGDVHGKTVLNVEFAVTDDDYLTVDTSRLRGTIFLHRADREVQVVDLDVELTLDSGEVVKIRDFVTLRGAVAGELTAWNGYRIEPEVRPL